MEMELKAQGGAAGVECAEPDAVERGRRSLRECSDGERNGDESQRKAFHCEESISLPPGSGVFDVFLFLWRVRSGLGFLYGVLGAGWRRAAGTNGLLRSLGSPVR